MGKNKELKKLEHLSLVTKISNELSNHIGISDRDAAEYLIHLYSKSSNYEDYKRRLEKEDFGFTELFIQNLHRLITALKPKKPATTQTSKPETATDKAKRFPGLSMPNKIIKSDDVAEADRRLESDISQHIDSLINSARESSDRRDNRRDHRNRSRSRSPSRMHRESRSEREYRDEPSRNHNRERSRDRSRRGSRWDNARDDTRDDRTERNRDSDRSRDRGSSRGDTGRSRDEAPVLYKIYSGRVTNVKGFGAFVSLDGLQGRVEGLVHVSAIRKDVRVENPSDVLERGQSVKVKVMSIEGSKLGLSMKDVDQSTGEDLSPEKYPGMLPESEVSRRSARESAQGAARPAGISGSNATELGTKRGYGEEPKRAPVGAPTGKRSSTKRLTSPERWEIKQLIASGVLDHSADPDLDEADEDGMPAFEEDEEELDIELREEEPDFLRGHT
ncbi:DEAH-box ATP-dependent RNA helicase prp22, partial [Coemansia sp. RSA 2703]